MQDWFKRVSKGVRCEKEGDSPGRGNHGESLPLRSLLDSRRMRREHTGRVSKDAYEAGQGEVKWFHHGCITILVVGCLKRCLYPSTGRSCQSTVVAALCGAARVKKDIHRKKKQTEKWPNTLLTSLEANRTDHYWSVHLGFRKVVCWRKTEKSHATNLNRDLDRGRTYQPGDFCASRQSQRPYPHQGSPPAQIGRGVEYR